MKIIVVLAVCLFLSRTIYAQTMDARAKKTDSIARLVVMYLKNKQPDSVYALTGKTFREKITPESFHDIAFNQLLPLSSFEKVSYVSNLAGINKYRVDGKPVLQLMVGLGDDNKIETLLVQPYVAD